MGIVVRNWRDQGPYVGHINALVWTLFRGKETEDSPETALLHGMNVFVKHGLQGRQHSDHHHHTDIEQMYFVLRGRGQLLIGDDKVDVQEGTAVYMPVNVPHQAFNDGDYWMEHLIVSCPLDEIREGTPAVRDWRDITPVIEEHGAIAWPLLTREGEATTTEGGVLQRMHSVTRYAVQGRQTTWKWSILSFPVMVPSNQKTNKKYSPREQPPMYLPTRFTVLSISRKGGSNMSLSLWK